MYAKLLGVLLFACQIVLNSSSVIGLADIPTVGESNSNPLSVEGDAVTENRPATLPEGYTRFPEDHAAYKIYEIFSTWFEGRDRCIEDGGRLAITDSYEKIRHVNSLKTEETKNRVKWLHVGIVKSTTNNDQWVRMDNNLPVTPMPWAEASPDGIGTCSGISVFGEGLTDYKCEWGDEYFVCEIPL